MQAESLPNIPQMVVNSVPVTIAFATAAEAASVAVAKK